MPCKKMLIRSKRFLTFLASAYAIQSRLSLADLHFARNNSENVKLLFTKVKLKGACVKCLRAPR